MGLRVATADERLAVANAETTVAIFGAAGSGKTCLARSLPPTVVIELEAGMKSLQSCGNRCRKSLGHGFAFDGSGK